MAGRHLPVADGRYTKTIQYQDINYQLSQNEDKTAIFEGWCDFLNYFDSSIRNSSFPFEPGGFTGNLCPRSIIYSALGDEFDRIRAEYAGMLQNQLARGNNGLIKTKYLSSALRPTTSALPSPVWSASKPIF